ncbi:MAG: Crp/Fnr family transcriptional regulator [Desulfobulbus propionicus]|nr:MAG: Crp/Fnr family transcriptional regulator [Desulfobulbus propionicus]
MKKYRDAIFVVVEDRSCPIYNVGEEFKVEKGALGVPQAKPACLLMVQEVMKVVSSSQSFERFTQQGIQKNKFTCGGCTGTIRFEFKQARGFATLQMKLLAAAEQKAKRRHIDEFFDLLRILDIFEPLSDDSLRDLSGLLQLRDYAAGKVILKKGEPGNNLFIVLEGLVAVIGDEGQTLTEMGPGDIFGEMSLLSGEPVTTSIYTRQKSKFATLSGKNFKYILNRFPVLQVFFYRMLVERAQTNSLRAGRISSGMTGRLSEVSAVDLFQMINSSQKSGRIQLKIENEGEAEVLFHDGELIHVDFRGLQGKQALFRLLGKNKGTFTYTSGISSEEKKLESIGGFFGLIMEGLRRIDEEQGEVHVR